MDFLVIVLMAVIITTSLALRHRVKQDRIERLRSAARLQVIESQLAGLRALLRISLAEHAARRAMTARRDPFLNHADHEEYRAS